jgi:hypothetical protein
MGPAADQDVFRTDKSLVHTRIWTPVHPPRSLVATDYILLFLEW